MEYINVFKEKDTKVFIRDKISKKEKNIFRKKLYNEIKDKYPNLCMFNATKQIKSINDFIKYINYCSYNNNYKNKIIYFEPNFKNNVWKQINSEIIQKEYQVTHFRWIALYLDNYATGSMINYRSEVAGINDIINTKYDIPICTICLEKNINSDKCTKCLKNICHKCKCKIEQLNTSYNGFVRLGKFKCPYCRHELKDYGIVLGIK
jgi:hypothetical protein